MGIITTPPGRGDGEALPSHPLPGGPLNLAGWMLAIVMWAGATGGGLGLFLYLARANRSVAGSLSAGGMEPAVAGATADVASEGAHATAPAVSSRARINTDESQLPRWLRPSVQAARHARPERE